MKDDGFVQTVFVFVATACRCLVRGRVKAVLMLLGVLVASPARVGSKSCSGFVSKLKGRRAVLLVLP